MPRIQEYNAPANVGLQPSEIGVEATAAAARRIGTFYHQEGQELGGAVREATGVAQKYIDHQEISHGALAFTGLMAQATDELNQTVKNADPNDPTVATKFMAGLEPRLQKFSESFQSEAGQKWAESRVDSLRTHLMTHVAAEMSTRAAQATATNLERIQNTSSNIVSQDPAMLPEVLGHYDASVDGVVKSAPNLTGTQAGQISEEVRQRGKKQITMAAIQGAIEKNPDAGLAMARDPRYSPYVDAREIKQFEQYAQYIQRTQRAEARADRQQHDYEARNDFNSRVNALEAQTAPQKPGDPPQLPADYFDRARELSKHPGAALEPGRLKTVIDNGESISNRLNKPEPDSRVSREVYVRLSRKISGIDGTRMDDEKEIWNESDKLTKADLNSLRAEFAGTKSPEGNAIVREREQFFKQYAPVIDAGFAMGEHSAAGSQMIYFAKKEAQRLENAAIKAGEDPRSVYDPSSRWFFGTQERISKYQITMQQIIEDQKNRADKSRVIAPPGQNLTSQGMVTGVDVIEQTPGAKTFVPPPNWLFNAKRQQYKDPDGKIYDVTGKPVEAR